MDEFGHWKTPESLTVEDEILLDYWRRFGGLIVAEVVVGGRGPGKIWPEGSNLRRIDAIRIANSHDDFEPVIWQYGEIRESLRELLFQTEIDVIEIKEGLGRYVIGQVIIGADLIELEHKPLKVNQIILCNEADPLMNFLCQRRNIQVWERST